MKGYNIVLNMNNSSNINRENINLNKAITRDLVPKLKNSMSPNNPTIVNKSLRNSYNITYQYIKDQDIVKYY